MTKKPWNAGRSISKQVFYEVMADPNGERKRVYRYETKELAERQLQSEMFWNKPGHYEIKKITLYFKEKGGPTIGQLKKSIRHILTEEKQIISYESSFGSCF